MISLILPYWKRQAAADAALEALAEHYADMEDLEVVVVDDGDPEPFRVPLVDLNLVCMRLPVKQEPSSCIKAWNHGVKWAMGDIIVLSCVEVLHERPVLQQMVKELERLGPKGYVLAAAWCPEHGEWHCHSSVSVPTCPPGSGIAFCGMLHRELFEEIGGFDEAFMAGVGYEDRDFIQRLHLAGAKFSIRDDLVVVHPKTGATIKWPAALFETNGRLYESRWLC